MSEIGKMGAGINLSKAVEKGEDLQCLDQESMSLMPSPANASSHFNPVFKIADWLADAVLGKEHKEQAYALFSDPEKFKREFFALALPEKKETIDFGKLLEWHRHQSVSTKNPVEKIFHESQMDLLEGRIPEAKLKLRQFKSLVSSADPEQKKMLQVVSQQLRSFSLAHLQFLSEKSELILAQRSQRIEGKWGARAARETQAMKPFLDTLGKIVKEGKADTLEEALAYMRSENQWKRANVDASGKVIFLVKEGFHPEGNETRGAFEYRYERFVGPYGLWNDIEKNMEGFKVLFELETAPGLQQMQGTGKRAHLLKVAQTLRSRGGSYVVAGEILEKIFEVPMKEALGAISKLEIRKINREVEGRRNKILKEVHKKLAELKDRDPSLLAKKFGSNGPSVDDLQGLVDHSMQLERAIRIRKVAFLKMDEAFKKGKFQTDPILHQAWKIYEDMKDPLDKTWNISDEGWDSIADETVMCAVTMPLTLGIGSGIRAGLGTSSLALRWMARGGLRAFAAESAIYAFTGGVEGILQPTFAAAIFGNDLELKQMGKMAVASFAFHWGGKLGAKVATQLGVGQEAIAQALLKGEKAYLLKVAHEAVSMPFRIATDMGLNATILSHEGGPHHSFMEKLGASALRMGAFHYGMWGANKLTGGRLLGAEMDAQARQAIARKYFQELRSNDVPAAEAARQAAEFAQNYSFGVESTTASKALDEKRLLQEARQFFGIMEDETLSEARLKSKYRAWKRQHHEDLNGGRSSTVELHDTADALYGFLRTRLFGATLPPAQSRKLADYLAGKVGRTIYQNFEGQPTPSPVAALEFGMPIFAPEKAEAASGQTAPLVVPPKRRHPLVPEINTDKALVPALVQEAPNEIAFSRDSLRSPPGGSEDDIIVVTPSGEPWRIGLRPIEYPVMKVHGGKLLEGGKKVEVNFHLEFQGLKISATMSIARAESLGIVEKTAEGKVQVIPGKEFELLHFGRVKPITAGILPSGEVLATAETGKTYALVPHPSGSGNYDPEKIYVTPKEVSTDNTVENGRVRVEFHTWSGQTIVGNLVLHFSVEEADHLKIPRSFDGKLDQSEPKKIPTFTLRTVDPKKFVGGGVGGLLPLAAGITTLLASEPAQAALGKALEAGAGSDMSGILTVGFLLGLGVVSGTSQGFFQRIGRWIANFFSPAAPETHRAEPRASNDNSPLIMEIREPMRVPTENIEQSPYRRMIEPVQRDAESLRGEISDINDSHRLDGYQNASSLAKIAAEGRFSGPDQLRIILEAILKTGASAGSKVFLFGEIGSSLPDQPELFDLLLSHTLVPSAGMREIGVTHGIIYGNPNFRNFRDLRKRIDQLMPVDPFATWGLPEALKNPNLPWPIYELALDQLFTFPEPKRDFHSLLAKPHPYRERYLEKLEANSNTNPPGSSYNSILTTTTLTGLATFFSASELQAATLNKLGETVSGDIGALLAVGSLLTLGVVSGSGGNFFSRMRRWFSDVFSPKSASGIESRPEETPESTALPFAPEISNPDTKGVIPENKLFLKMSEDSFLALENVRVSVEPAMAKTVEVKPKTSAEEMAIFQLRLLSTDPAERQDALEAMMAHHARWPLSERAEALHQIYPLLEDTHPPTRRSAVEAFKLFISDMDSPVANEWAKRFASQFGNHNPIRSQATLELYGLCLKRVHWRSLIKLQENLEPLLSSDSHQIRGDAVEALFFLLEKLPPPDQVPGTLLLIKAIDDGHPQVRHRSSERVKKIVGSTQVGNIPPLGEALLALMNSPFPFVRRSVVEILGILAPRLRGTAGSEWALNIVNLTASEDGSTLEDYCSALKKVLPWLERSEKKMVLKILKRNLENKSPNARRILKEIIFASDVADL